MYVIIIIYCISYCIFNFLCNLFFSFLTSARSLVFFVFFKLDYDKLLFCKKPFSSVNNNIICPCEFFFKTILWVEQVSHKKSLMEDNILYFVYKNKISHQSFLNFEFFLFKKVYVPMYLYFFLYLLCLLQYIPIQLSY